MFEFEGKDKKLLNLLTKKPRVLGTLIYDLQMNEMRENFFSLRQTTLQIWLGSHSGQKRMVLLTITDTLRQSKRGSYIRILKAPECTMHAPSMRALPTRCSSQSRTKRPTCVRCALKKCQEIN